MKTLTLSKQQARRVMLAHQGLWPPYQLEGKAGILDYVRRVGCIQFDPLNIAGHNHELVLQSRVSDFQPAMLQELLYQGRKLLDGWDKNMSIYSVEDWPYFRRSRESARRHYGHDGRPATAIMPQIRQEIEERGPLSSIDLDFNHTVDWSWAPTRIARAALESMYFWGELITHHTVHTRRIYDFAHRHIPEELLSAEEPNKTEKQYHDWRVLRRIGSMGLVWNKSGDAWLGISGIKSKERQTALTRLLKQNKLIEVQVEGIKIPFYIRSEDRMCLETAMNGTKPTPKAAILAPLDNLIWDRRLIKELFDFEYRWEVYKPVAEREYGYYVLPVLYGDRFVARFEPVRDKKNGTVTIKNWWWEPGVRQSKRMQAALNQAIQRFLRFLDTTQLQLDPKIVKQARLEWLES
jgi:uncharacterized protein YcaQ